MSETEIQVLPWFRDHDPITLLALTGTDKVAYSWVSIPGTPEGTKDLEHLLVWHYCDKHLWYDDPTKNRDIIPDYVGWHPAGVGAHDFVSAEPLELSPSVYWPDCCGMHGFIRAGAWIPA